MQLMKCRSVKMIRFMVRNRKIVVTTQVKKQIWHQSFVNIITSMTLIKYVCIINGVRVAEGNARPIDEVQLVINRIFYQRKLKQSQYNIKVFHNENNDPIENMYKTFQQFYDHSKQLAPMFWIVANTKTK